MCRNDTIINGGEYIFSQHYPPKFQRQKRVGQQLPFFIFNLLQFHELCEFMCEYEHLLEHKKFDLDFLCGNGTITNGGGYICHKNQNCHWLFYQGMGQQLHFF